ncbi:MAG TPA: SulP family inorganic anion transporter [Usitatibacter sp.]|nr:SulP family inorganic anion transporter [Usitatibacter sp.]
MSQPAQAIDGDASAELPRPPRRGVSFADEASGAFAATLVALPQALSLGVLAFAALGPAYAGAGVVAALLASVVGNLVASSTYAVKCQIVGARSATTALVASLVAALAADPSLQGANGPDVPAILALVFAAIAISGALQVAFGFWGFGRAIKYIPYPVVAGFMNGIAIIIVASQLRAILGLEGHQSLVAHLGSTRWGSVATTAVVVAAIFLVPRFARRVPPLVAGLAAGVTAHYLIAAVSPESVGGVVGALPSVLPTPGEAQALLEAFGRIAHVHSSAVWEVVLPAAVLLSIVGALDGLLAAVISDGITRGRHDSNRVLLGKGLGNIVGGLLGALPAQLNAHTPIANFRAGGRTRWATLLHALFMLVIAVALAPAVAGIPTAALAGIMVFIAYSLVDRWSGDLLSRLRIAREDRKEMVVNIAIVAFVAFAQVALNIMVALAIGVIACVTLLLVKLSGNPVRRHLDGAVRSSHKVRSPEARAALRAVAAQVRILELQGELFFGTADNLQSQVELLPEEVRYVILDFRRVHQVDASGARVLQIIGQRAQARGIRLALSDVRGDERRGRYFHALGLEAAIPPERWFADLDRALEWAEDELLGRSRFNEAADSEIPLDRMALFHGLSKEEVERLSHAFERRELADGEPVFLEGQHGDRLYLIARGSVSIKVRIAGEVRARRLATFTPGVIFGEMALLEGKDRSADAFAKGDRVVLHSLSAAKFERLVQEDPLLGSRILRNLSRELAARLRATTEAMRALE